MAEERFCSHCHKSLGLMNEASWAAHGKGSGHKCLGCRRRKAVAKKDGQLELGLGVQREGFKYE